MEKISLRFQLVAILISLTIINAQFLQGQEKVSILINPSKVEGRIDEKVYGHFLEHIYHSVNGGLWGELIWNRSFEESLGIGDWTIKDDCLIQSKMADNVRLVFGDKDWSDYEFTLEAQKTSGAEGFLILFRVSNDEEFYWYNIGGWGNIQSALEKGVKDRGWGIVGPIVQNRIETGKWYQIQVRCEGAHFKVLMDGDTLLDYTDNNNPHLRGSVGVGTWNTKAKYRNIQVKSLDGETLFEGLPDIEAEQAVARHWQFYGEGEAYLSEDNPYNSSLSQVITSEGDEVGLEQEPFCIRKGETYEGSLWVRGEAPEGVIVRFLDGSETIKEINQALEDNEWLDKMSIEFEELEPDPNTTLFADFVLVFKKGSWIYEPNIAPRDVESTVYLTEGPEMLVLSNPKITFEDENTILWTYDTCKVIQTENGKQSSDRLLALQLIEMSRKSDHRVCVRCTQKKGNEWVVQKRTSSIEQPESVQAKVESTKWQEHKFIFRAETDSKEGKLQIGIKGQGEIWLDQVSLMTQSAKKVGGYRPDLLQAVVGLSPPIIRWPGGCFASPYRWKDGIGPQDKRVIYPRQIWDDLEVNAYGTDEFIRMCKSIGAEPLIVVNIGTTNWNDEPNPEEFMQDVLDWIGYCNGPTTSEWGKVRAQNGHPEPYNVKYWEIDNETWHMGVDSYVEAVKRFAPPMRKKDPTIKLAACGSGGFNMEWNRKMIEECAELIDYLSIHHYENPDQFAQGPFNYERFIRQTGELISKSKNPNLKIYCSEWNAQSIDWRTGLYAGGVLNAFERCAPTFEIGGPALFLRHQSATAWNNAFINFDHCGWFAAPNYVVMKLWREHFAPYRIGLESDIKALNVIATKSQDGKSVYVKAVNPSDKEVEVSLSIDKDYQVKNASMKIVAPGTLAARNTLEEPAAVRPVEGDVEISGQEIKFNLPSLSVAVVTIEG